VTASRTGAARAWVRRNGEWARDSLGGWSGGEDDEESKEVTLDKAGFCAQHCFPSISLAQTATQTADEAIPGGECVTRSPALQELIDQQKHKQEEEQKKAQATAATATATSLGETGTAAADAVHMLAEKFMDERRERLRGRAKKGKSSMKLEVD